jgi:DNA-binding NarL/FixJ family response regulator
MSAPRILIVDADRELRVWLQHHIEILWPDSKPESLDVTGVDRRVTTAHFDVLLYGIRLDEDAANLEACFARVRRLAAQPDSPPVIVLAKGGDEFTAVRAIKAGAFDYLPRAHLDAKRLATALRNAVQSAMEARPSARGKRADRPEVPQYSLLHELGESVRATVYLAYSTALGRNVALKISKSGPGAEEQQQFGREYAAISALKHRSVVEIYDYGFHEGHEFIAMEYFPCGDLKMRLAQPLTSAEALEYARLICVALQVVHGAGLLHRDLKPPNVMLREDGSIVLIDFGLAKQIDAYTHSTAIGVLRGSPYYMSPEQALGQTLDARSDLYSVGVILYEMLAGWRPYSGATAVEVMEQHVKGRRPPLPQQVTEFESVIASFMAVEPAQRVTDAASAAAALAAAAVLAEVRAKERMIEHGDAAATV